MTEGKTRSAAGKAAVNAAKRRSSNALNGKPVQLSSGAWVLIKPVSPSVIADAQAGIEEPQVPTWFNADKGRDEPNPNDPSYLQAVDEAQAARVLAGLDALILFGTELVDAETGEPVGPPEDGWLGKLRLMEKMGRLDLGVFDLDEKLDKEFLYKRYIAVTATDLAIIAGATGLTTEDIQAAERSFRSN